MARSLTATGPFCCCIGVPQEEHKKPGSRGELTGGVQKVIERAQEKGAAMIVTWYMTFDGKLAIDIGDYPI